MQVISIQRRPIKHSNRKSRAESRQADHNRNASVKSESQAHNRGWYGGAGESLGDGEDELDSM